MIRYRTRVAGTKDDWSRPVGRRRALRVVRKQLHRGPRFRWRRRDRVWGVWWRSRVGFMAKLKRVLGQGKLGNYQVQLNDGRYQIGILKFNLPLKLDPGERAVKLALSELGTPYRFGEANGPEDPGTDGFDCSGLTQWAWAGAAGIALPHAARLQEDAPNVWNFTIQKWLKPGDLVFFWFPNSRQIRYPTPSHVGLWLKPGFVVDTRSQSKPVAVRAIEQGNVVGYGRPQ